MRFSTSIRNRTRAEATPRPSSYYRPSSYVTSLVWPGRALGSAEQASWSQRRPRSFVEAGSWNNMDFQAHSPTSSQRRIDDQNRNHCWVVLATPATAEETRLSTWRDRDTRCVYLKAGDAVSPRYRCDGTPDCASVQQDSTDASITRGDLREATQQIVRYIEELRRDIGEVRRKMEHTRNDLKNIRRETRQPRAQWYVVCGS